MVIFIIIFFLEEKIYLIKFFCLNLVSNGDRYMIEGEKKYLYKSVRLASRCIRGDLLTVHVTI